MAGCTVVVALAGALAGCSMSSLTTGIGSGWFGGGEKAKTETGSVSEDQLLAAAKTDSGATGSLGGVDMAVAEAQRLLHHPDAGAASQIPSSEADRRNVGVTGSHNRDVHHAMRP